MPMNPRLLRPKKAAATTPVFTPEGYPRLWAVTSGCEGNIAGSASSDTGSYAVKWWDNTVETFSSGDPFSKAVASGPQAFEVYPVSAPYSTSLLLNFDGDDESTTFTDSSDNALTVTPYGSAEISTAESKFGGASGFFDGSTAYLTAPSLPALGAGDFTIECWLLLQSAPEANFFQIAGQHEGGVGADWWLAVATVNTEDPVLYFETPGVGFFGSAPLAVSSGWVHVAVVRSGGVLYMYVDGVGENVGASSADVQSTRTFSIGAEGNGALLLDGYIDDLRIVKGHAAYTATFTPPTAALSAIGGASGAPAGQFDAFDVSGNCITSLRAESVALDTSEIGDLSNNALTAAALDQFYTDLDAGSGELIVAGNPGDGTDDKTIAEASGYTVTGYPPPVSLLLHFDGDDESTVFTDSSDNALPVTAEGTAQLTTDESQFGGASLSLDGSGYATVPYSAALGLADGDFTVECWAFVNSGGVHMLASGYSATFSQWLFYLDGSGISFLASDAPYTWVMYISATVAIPTGEWVHLAMVRSLGVGKLFVNGVDVGGTASSPEFSIPPGDVVCVGSILENGASRTNMTGYIDDLRITRGVAIYDGDFDPPESALTTTAEPYTAYKAYGTLLFSECVDGDLVGTYADGSGGRYTETISVGSC